MRVKKEVICILLMRAKIQNTSENDCGFCTCMISYSEKQPVMNLIIQLTGIDFLFNSRQFILTESECFDMIAVFDTDGMRCPVFEYSYKASVITVKKQCVLISVVIRQIFIRTVKSVVFHPGPPSFSESCQLSFFL